MFDGIERHADVLESIQNIDRLVPRGAHSGSEFAEAWGSEALILSLSMAAGGQISNRRCFRVELVGRLARTTGFHGRAHNVQDIHPRSRSWSLLPDEISVVSLVAGDKICVV